MKVSSVFVVLAAALATGAAIAQDTFPTRAITMIVPFPPGGVADVTGRPTAHAMEKILKQPVVVSNRPGAGGAVGNAAVANAKPDGYTILMALSSISVIPAADALFDRKPAYSLDQFAPIALITADPTILTVHPSLPAKSVKELVALAPLEAGPALVLLFRHLRRASHADGDVPARGEAQDAPRADDRRRPRDHHAARRPRRYTAGGPAAITPHVKAGKLRPLASWGPKRHEGYPDVPTFKELGYDIEYLIWAGMFVPKATSPAVIKVLRDAARKAVEDAEFKAMMAKVNSPVHYLDAPEFTKFWQARREAARRGRESRRQSRRKEMTGHSRER